MRPCSSACLLALIVCWPVAVAAQEPPPAPGARARHADQGRFPGAGPFVDAALSHYALRSEIIDGDAMSPVVAAGYQVSRRLSLRVEAAVGTKNFDRTRHARFVLQSGSESVDEALRQMSREELERVWPETDLRVSRRVAFLTSVLAGVHGNVGSRIRLALLGGLTLQRERSVEVREDPTLLDLSPRYAFETQTTGWARTQVLVASGLDMEISVSRHIALVPQLRLDVGKDANDPDDWLVVARPGLALRWMF